jgi:cytoskeletal protein CcmA (bactofilin family)
MSDPDGSTKKTIIEQGTEFEGSITSTCDVELRGRIRGDLLAPALTIDPSGSVQGCIKVDRLISEGEISGEIDAQNVQLSGKVSDQTVIKAETLEVKLKKDSGVQVTFGECELRVGDRASRDGRVEKVDTYRTPVHAKQ